MGVPTIALDNGGDWVALYDTNGELIDEGHSFDPVTLLDLLGVPHKVKYVNFDDRAPIWADELEDM